MTNEEINRYIHAEIMGKGVDHQWQETPSHPTCKLCGESYTDVFAVNECPKASANYCSDDSPRRLLNEVTAKIESTEDLICFFVQITGWHAYELRATAAQIARACVEAHKGGK